MIVCEGEKTEPNYFNALKNDLHKGKIEIVDIKGLGKNTKSIIKDAKRLGKEYEANDLRKLDQVWAVFDRDSFPAKNFAKVMWDKKILQIKILVQKCLN